MPASSCFSTDELMVRAQRWVQRGERVLCVGASGLGKSTWIERLALSAPAALVLSVDVAKPLCGPPGAVVLSSVGSHGLAVEAMEGVATLDGVRHRHRVLVAAHRLAQGVRGVGLLVDSPGVLRGKGARELVTGLVALLQIDRVVCFTRATHVEQIEGAEREMLDVLGLTQARVELCTASEQARKMSPGERQRVRDEAWQGWMARASSLEILEDEVVWVNHTASGCPALPGDHVALIDALGHTCGIGVMGDVSDGRVQVRAATFAAQLADVRGVVSADAVIEEGELKTRTARAPKARAHTREVAAGAAFSLPQKPVFRVNLGRGPFVRGASLRTTFVSDLFEDPMVLLRMDHQQRSLCLDLGSVQKVPTKVMHQTSDVLLSHAHLDHVGGMPWVLRKRIGIEQPLRVWGPRDIIQRIWHGVQAYTWDRIGARGPRFEVHEWDGGSQLKRARIQAGVDEVQWMPPLEVRDNVLWREPLLQVEARVLDHGGTDVLAFGVQEPVVYAVRGDVVKARGWKAGRWLGQLKVLVAAGSMDTVLEVLHLDGQSSPWDVETLAGLLLIPKQGQRIVYATDFADSPENLSALVELAQGANILICEAGFVMEDAARAADTGHMTTKACAEVAARAEVDVLVPFHHSMRYDEAPEHLYAEVLAGFERTYIPAEVRARMRAAGLLKT